MPHDFAETPEGLVLIQDGIDQTLRWDGFATQAEIAGTVKPTTKATMAGSGRGNILGTYRCFVRFVDAFDNASDLSPVSDDLVAQVSGGSVGGADTNSPIGLTILNHGLTSGALINVDGVNGQTGANGQWQITVLNSNKVILIGSTSTAAYTGGGTWSTGYSTITYSNVPTTSDPQIRRRQILRNLDGEAFTYYVDVDTTDLSASTFTSTIIDNDLSTHTAVAITNAAGDDLGNVHARPPANKCYLAHQQGRMFYAGEVEYGEGAVALAFGSSSVSGIGTEWSSQMAGRFLYIVGANSPYEIVSVNADAQTLVLTLPYGGNTDPYASYSIRPAPAEARNVAFSEAGQCESVPAVNGLTLPDDGDRVSGLMSLASFIYIIERKHLYRLTFQDSPVVDGALFLAGDRGCVNQRCWIIVETAAYMLDEQGVHVFESGRDKGSISTPIQTLFRSREQARINWSASRFFHAVHDPSTETIRWFVALSGQYLPRHAICYQYTLDRWWIEEFPFPIGASALGKLARQSSAGTWGVGREQVFLGTTGRRVLAFDAGALDGPDPEGAGIYGDVSAAGTDWIEVAGEVPTDAAGFPVCISSGRGRDQWRIAVSVSGNRVRVRRPWLITPDATSKCIFGGIGWRYKTGWFRWVDEEDSNSRRVELMFEPNDTGAITMRRYRDRSDEPMKVAITRADDGVSTTAGSGDIEINMNRPSGFAQVRLDGSKEQYSHGPRLISVELGGFSGTQPVRVDQITLDGVKG